MDSPKPILVIIRTREGKYLTGDEQHWEFTDDPAKARVFDLLRDRIQEQLEKVRKERHLLWAAVPIDPKDRYETCDRCGSRIVCREAFFDGAVYICRKCRGSTTQGFAASPSQS